MRKRIAIALVRWISRWHQAAYAAYFDGLPRAEKFFVGGANRIQKFALPIALRLDREAATTQMIDEAWWG